MPRPAGRSLYILYVLLFLPVTALTSLVTAASQQPQATGAGSHQGFGGIWVIDRNLGDAPGAPNVPSEASGSGRGPGRGGGRMGRGDGVGRGVQLGAQDPEHRAAIGDYVRAAMESSKQLIIVVHESSVSITDAEGRVSVLQTDNKKVSERAQNGLVKLNRKNHWDDETLESEFAIENGPRILRSYSLSPGGTQLRVTTSAEGDGPAFKLTRIYERPVEAQ